MNPNQIAMTLALLAVAPLASATSKTDHAPAHAHEHHGHVATAELPAKSQRWAVDAALQTGIGKIQVAVDRLGQTGKDAPARAEVVQLAAEIEVQVQYLISNCKLEPAADAALHGIIGRLLGAASTLKAKPQLQESVAQLRAALADYPKFFDDPSWVTRVD